MLSDDTQDFLNSSSSVCCCTSCKSMPCLWLMVSCHDVCMSYYVYMASSCIASEYSCADCYHDVQTRFYSVLGYQAQRLHTHAAGPHMQLAIQKMLADLALGVIISSEVPRLQLVCLPVLVVGGTLRALMTAYWTAAAAAHGLPMHSFSAHVI